MFKKSTLLIAVLVAITVSSLNCAVAAEKTKTVIAIPTRYRVVALMQDIARLRVVTLLSYQGEKTSAAPTLHTWDGKKWASITVGDYADTTEKDRVILIGDEDTVPGTVVAASGRDGAEVFRISSLDVSTIVTKLSKVFELSTKELQWIAQRQGLKVKDLNADRRRYGRYGKPGGKDDDEESLEEAAEEEVVMPASPVGGEDVGSDVIPEEPEFEPVEDEVLYEKGIAEKGME